MTELEYKNNALDCVNDRNYTPFDAWEYGYDCHRIWELMQNEKRVKLHAIKNKEFIDLLKKYPEDAFISIECCDPRSLQYDKINNLIRID